MKSGAANQDAGVEEYPKYLRDKVSLPFLQSEAVLRL